MTVSAQTPPDVQQQTKKPQPEWGVTFPDAEQVAQYKRDSLVAACYGYDRLASVLNYLLYQASWERSNQKLPKECKVVTFTRTHKDILKALTFKLSRKTLISYLDKLAEWKYVDSQKFQRIFTVHFDTIQGAINTPPARPVRPARAKKGCKVVKVQPSEREQELAKKVEELQQNVELLQHKVEELQPLVCNLTTLQRGFSALVESLQGHFSNDSILLSISSLFSINKGDTGASAPTPPVSNVSDFLSESAKLRALKTVSVASVAHSQTAHDELPPDIEDWDTSGLDSTQEMRAVRIGGQDAAVHAGNDHGAGAGVPLPGHTDAGRVPAHPGAAAHVAAAHAAHRDTRGYRLAVPAATPAATEPPDAPLDACSGPLFAGQDGAAPPTGGSLSPSLPASQPRASGAVIAPLSVQSETPPTLTRKQQDRLIAQTIAAYWAVIEAWKGQKYSQAQRAQACHTSGLEAMYADGVTPDALTAKLKLLDDFQKRTFNVNRLYLEWWNNLDETQPAKTNGKASRGRPPEDENDPYSFVSILKRQAEQEAASA